MSHTPQQFFQKLSKLHPNFDWYCGSTVLSENLNALVARVGIGDAAYWSDLLGDLVVEDFNLVDLDARIRKDLGVSIEQSKNATTDFLGVILLPIDEYLPDVDVAGEIKKRGGQTDGYKIYVNALKNALEDEVLTAAEEYIDNFQKTVNPKEEKASALFLLKNNLHDILLGTEIEPLATLNGGLVYLLFNVDGFKDDAVRAIMENEQKFTSLPFMLKGKKVAPTIGNWIADFLSRHGSGNFDNLILANFITTSPNAKGLSEDDWRRLGRLLELYRNLRFWPQSVGEKEPDQWHIVPLPKTSEDLAREHTLKAPLPNEVKTSDFQTEPKQTNNTVYRQDDGAKLLKKSKAAELLPDFNAELNQKKSEDFVIEKIAPPQRPEKLLTPRDEKMLKAQKPQIKLAPVKKQVVEPPAVKATSPSKPLLAKEQKIKELETIIATHKQGSIERQALEWELARLRNA